MPRLAWSDRRQDDVRVWGETVLRRWTGEYELPPIKQWRYKLLDEAVEKELTK